MNSTIACTTNRKDERRELLASLAKKAITGIALATLVAAASARDTHPGTRPVSQKPADVRQAAAKPATPPAWIIHYRVR